MRHNYFILLLLVASLIFTASISAQEIEGFNIKRLTENIAVFISEEAGADQLVISSERGMVIVDTQWSNITAAKFREAISKYFERNDFLYTINSVDRLDMFGGNETYKDSTIVGHEGFNKFTEEVVTAEIQRLIEMWRWKEGVSRDRLKTHEAGSEQAKNEENWMLTCKRRADELESSYSFRLPDITYRDRIRLDLGNTALELIYFGEMGYNGVSVIMLPEEKAVIFTGFILHSQHLAPHPQERYARLDVPRWIRVMREVLVENSEIEKVIADTRYIWSKEKALEHLNYIETLWETVTAAESEGKSLEEVQALCSLDGAFSFVKDIHVYKDHGDDWVRPQHIAHVKNFYLQHKNNVE